MRTREEIEKTVGKIESFKDNATVHTVFLSLQILDVLLDIRDLLTQKEK